MISIVLLFNEEDMRGDVRVYVIELKIAAYILIKLGQTDGITKIASFTWLSKREEYLNVSLSAK